jgi:hypothetical protein
MAFEKMRRKALATCDSHHARALDAAAIGYLAKALPLAEARSIAEINPAGPELAQRLCSVSGASYRGIRFGSRDSCVSPPLETKISWAQGAETGELPLPNQSQDLLLSCHALDRVRLDFLYMICSEARRVCKVSGHWAVLANDPGKNGSLTRFLSRLRANSGAPILDFSHYISPEDWETVTDIYLAPRERLFILKRIPSPA